MLINEIYLALPQPPKCLSAKKVLLCHQNQTGNHNSENSAIKLAAAAKLLQSCLTVQPHRRPPTKLPRPWDSLGKNTGVGCHFLLQCVKVKSESEVAQSCPTLSDLMDCSLPGSSIHGIFQSRVLEWVLLPSLIKLADAEIKCGGKVVGRFNKRT